MLKAFARFRHSYEFWLLAGILVVAVVLSVMTDTFLTLENLFDLLTENAYVGILCAGLMVVLISGGIDISFTATASVAQYIALTVANAFPIGWLGVFLVACAVGTTLGTVNAVVIYRFRMVAIIATIALLNVYFGLLIVFSGGSWIYKLPDWYMNGVNWFAVTGANGYTYSLNLQIIVLIFAFGCTWLLLRRTSIGRQIYAVGGNPDAAQRIGFNMFALSIVIYGYLGLMAGLASIVQAQLAQTVMPNALVGRELDVLAAVVLGGSSLNGGSGSVLGTILGLTLFALMRNGLVLVGVSSYWLQAVTGIVLIAAMSITAIQVRRAQFVRRTGGAK
jgi:simple sugar transport system permease protein